MGEEAYAIARYAKLWLFPSIDEGFGIPLLEALYMKVPIITSARGALAEIGNDVCIYTKPYEYNDIFRKIQFILDNPNKVKKIVEKGYERVKNFKWENFIRRLIITYNYIIKKDI
jgi:glycosyltransferase involved in cell wall biosynthesis